MEHRKPRVLFILKFREGYSNPVPYSYSYHSSGLYWSAKFVVDMLNESGVEAKLVQVVDNNSIDKEVHDYKPTIVIIEALWVVPEKFEILRRLHPHVKWIVRLHSNIPFLANEGIAVKWIKSYAARGVKVAVNEKRAYNDLQDIISDSHLKEHIIYLPNYYPVPEKRERRTEPKHVVRVCCYGAIRPMKNQLIQAIAAMSWADENDKILHFHINATRVEMGGANILENLRALFKNTRHTLIEDHWFRHSALLEKLAYMHLGMQVSLSETFAITAADMVSAGLPIVVSPEIEWAAWISKVDPTNAEHIRKSIEHALTFPKLNNCLSRQGLISYSNKARACWLDYIERK